MNTFPDVSGGLEPASLDRRREKRLVMIGMIMVTLIATLSFMMPERLGATARLIGMLGAPLLFVAWSEYRRQERGGSMGIFTKAFIVILGIVVFRFYLVIVAACFVS